MSLRSISLGGKRHGITRVEVGGFLVLFNMNQDIMGPRERSASSDPVKETQGPRTFSGAVEDENLML